MKLSTQNVLVKILTGRHAKKDLIESDNQTISQNSVQTI